MLPRCVRSGSCCRRLCGAAAGPPEALEPLLQLCVDRYYVSSGRANTERFRRGTRCTYGPLGAELRRNLLDQWWQAVGRSSARVFGIDSVSSGREGGGPGPLRVVDPEAFTRLLQRAELSREQLVREAGLLLQGSPAARTSLLQGALEQFVPALELVNRKLPFGLAEAGPCFQPPEGSGCPAEVTQTSLVWFCSPRTSSQWLDHWTRQRLKWWRKVSSRAPPVHQHDLRRRETPHELDRSRMLPRFALAPSHFNSSEVPAEELVAAASRGVRIQYSFPWGQETLETLWSRGDAELLHTHQGVHAKLQCRDGKKSVPHVVSATGNVDRGVMAFLSNSLQQTKQEDGRQKLLQRKVLKLHPVLTPVKVALNISRGATVELRQVCDGLLQEFQEGQISTWPGYLEPLPTSMEQLNAKYDEMGVLFTVVIGENTLESGLLQVRSRDTTIKETMHISEIRKFLSRYISAADSN